MKKLRLNPWFFIPYVLVLAAALLHIVRFPKGTFLLWVNSHHSPFFDNFFLATNYLGEEVFASVVIAALIVFTSYATGLTAAVAWLVAGTITQMFKQLVFTDMDRPYRYFQGLHNVYFVPGVKMYEHFSFPSGHTTVAFALCTVLALSVKHRPLGLFFLFMAIVAGLSRIYLAQHFLMDTVGGSLIGCSVGIVLYTLVQHYLAKRPHHFLHRNLIKSLR